jgi:hypothetical protein
MIDVIIWLLLSKDTILPKISSQAGELFGKWDHHQSQHQGDCDVGIVLAVSY